MKNDNGQGIISRIKQRIRDRRAYRKLVEQRHIEHQDRVNLWQSRGPHH